MHIRLIALSVVLCLVSACVATSDAPSADKQPAQEFLPDGGPPVVNGFYETPDRPCVVRCTDGLLKKPAALREQPDPNAPVVATTRAYEWVSIVGGVFRMRPVRITVAEPYSLELQKGTVIEFETGDVLYLIDDRAYDDLPSFGFWFRGDYFYKTAPGFEQDGEVPFHVNWPEPNDEQIKADEAAGAGWWALVKRDNGQSGYVLRAELECWWPVWKDPPSYCQEGRR